jgi:hypothetical protein
VVKSNIPSSCADICRFHFHGTLKRDGTRKKNEIVICKSLIDLRSAG